MNEILPEIFEEVEVKHESADRPMGGATNSHTRAGPANLKCSFLL
ncbi:hypothetical protein [Pseudomonas sp. COR18]